MEAHENKVWNRNERVVSFHLDSTYTHPREHNRILFFGSRDIGKIWASERFHSLPSFLSWFKSFSNLYKNFMMLTHGNLLHL